MSPEKQRIAIAEFCGWEKQVRHDMYWNKSVGRYASPSELPDYLNDLNELNKAVLKLEHKLQPIYMNELLHVIYRTNRDIGVSEFDKHTATAAQRAEALLKTISRWTE